MENRFTGWKDIEITEKGEQEARSVALKIKDENIDIAFTSTLIRAQHTLRIIQELCGWQNIPVIINKALNERSYGELEGMNKAETAKKLGDDQVNIWRRSYAAVPPGGESLKDTYNKVIPYFKSFILSKLSENKNIILVAHGNSLRSLVMYLEHLSPEEIMDREIETCIPLIYQFNNGQIEEILSKNSVDNDQFH